MQKHFDSQSKISNIYKCQVYLAGIFLSTSKTLHPSEPTLPDLYPASSYFLFYMQEGNSLIYQHTLSPWIEVISVVTTEDKILQGFIAGRQKMNCFQKYLL